MPTGSTQNRTETDWVDTGRTQTDPVEDFDEKEQRRLVTYEQEEELRPNPYNEPNRWVLIREFEYRWIPIEDPPPPPVVTHRWRFDRYTGCGPNRKRRQECTNGHARHTRLRSAPEDYIWGFHRERRWAHYGHYGLEGPGQSLSIRWNLQEDPAPDRHDDSEKARKEPLWRL